MRRLMSIIITVALVLAQSTIAGAFQSDGIAGPFTASANLAAGAPVATLTVSVKNASDGSNATTLGWSGVTQGATNWKASDQYLEVVYNANRIGWGVQIYTDNKSASANPQYSGNPTADPNQQPAGLIGVSNTLLTCPTAVLVTKGRVDASLIQTPVEATSGTPGQADYSVYFNTGYDENTSVTGSEKVWFWLKDKQNTKWVDTDNNGEIDTGELVSDFSATGDDYATVINAFGSSTGWAEPSTGKMQRDNTATSPVCVYVAAKFSNATELQEYKTNTLTLEIYHE